MPTKPILGFRQSLTNSFTWITCRKMLSKIERVSQLLLSLNLVRGPDNLCIIGLLSKNRPEWVIFDIACSKLGLTTLPLFETGTASWLEKIINQVNLKYIFTDAGNLLRLINMKKEGKIAQLSKIFYTQKPNNEELHLAESSKTELFYYSECLTSFTEARKSATVFTRKNSSKVKKHSSMIDSVPQGDYVERKLEHIASSVVPNHCFGTSARALGSIAPLESNNRKKSTST